MRKIILPIFAILVVFGTFKLHPFLAIGALLIYSLIEICEAWREEAGVLKQIRILCLISIFFGITYYSALDTFKPTISKVEAHSLADGTIKFSKGGNIYFSTKKPIFQPISLRVKDDWRALHFRTDYQILDNRIVYINYPFGNDEKINRQHAENGLVFTYYTKAWVGSKEYKDYQADMNRTSKEMGIAKA